MGESIRSTEVGWQPGPVSDLLDEKVAEFQDWRTAMPVWDRMRKEDQVSAVIRAITLPIRSTQWRLDPNGAPDDVARSVGRQLDLPVIGHEDEEAARRPNSFSWAEYLRMALLSLPFGVMPFEKVWQTEFVDGLPVTTLRKAAPRLPWTLSDIIVDRDGGLVAIEQKAAESRRNVLDTVSSKRPGCIRIDVENLVVHAHEREGGDWSGTSILRPAYRSWILKDEFLRIEAIGARRNSVGVPVYTNPEGASDEDIALGRQMANSYRVGDSAGASLPNGSTLELKGVSGSLMNPRSAIEYHDGVIARTVLAHFLNLGGQGGSYALASTQADLFVTSLRSVAESVRDVTNAHLVEDIVDKTFGPDTPCPRVVFDAIGESSLSIATAIRTLSDAGVLIPDMALQEYVRRELGLPAPGGKPMPTPNDGGEQSGPIRT